MATDGICCNFGQGILDNDPDNELSGSYEPDTGSVAGKIKRPPDGGAAA